MARSNAYLLALKAELTNDPRSLELDTNPAHDEANADKLNAVAALLVKRRSLSTADLFNAIDPIEHQSLSDQQARWLGAVLSLGQVDPSTDDVLIAGLDQMFGADSTSRPAYTALLTEPGSRVTQMFQAGLLDEGNQVTPSDVANARQAT